MPNTPEFPEASQRRESADGTDLLDNEETFEILEGRCPPQSGDRCRVSDDEEGFILEIAEVNSSG